MEGDRIHRAYSNLYESLKRDYSEAERLRRWSLFIRTRDGFRCIGCGTPGKVHAHHIIRKSLMSDAAYLTGNGATLCVDCHREVHKGFNGKPDLNLLMDEQGGEKCEIMAQIYRSLVTSAYERKLVVPEYYALNENVLGRLKMLQSYDAMERFPGYLDIEKAYFIWNAAPMRMRNAILEANGFSPLSSPSLPGVTVLYDDEE